jgi:hypothetical protein
MTNSRIREFAGIEIMQVSMGLNRITGRAGALPV